MHMSKKFFMTALLMLTGLSALSAPVVLAEDTVQEVAVVEAVATPAPLAVDTGDTAWVLVSAALVLMMTPALGLPDPAYYSRGDADTKALMSRYADYVRRILALTGVPEKNLAAETAAVLDVEKRIAAIARPLVELRDPKNNFAPIDTASLGKQYRNLQLDAFLKAQGVIDDTVSMANPAMFVHLEAHVGVLKPVLSRGPKISMCHD